MLAVLLLVAVAAPAAAGVELTLDDGRRFTGSGADYKRDEGIYVIELDSGDLLPIPAELVKSVRLTGGDAPAPTGINVTRPRTLAGPEEIEPPTRSEQLRVFEGSEARFRRNLINPFWRPSSDWEMSTANNDFNPARWYEAPIPFEWVPRSAFTTAGDVTEFSPARWRRPLIDFEWVPEDGFAPR